MEFPRTEKQIRLSDPSLIPLVLGMEVLMKNALELLNFVTFAEHDLEYLYLLVTNIHHHRIPLGATKNKK